MRARCAHCSRQASLAQARVKGTGCGRMSFQGHRAKHTCNVFLRQKSRVLSACRLLHHSPAYHTALPSSQTSADLHSRAQHTWRPEPGFTFPFVYVVMVFDSESTRTQTWIVSAASVNIQVMKTVICGIKSSMQLVRNDLSRTLMPWKVRHRRCRQTTILNSQPNKRLQIGGHKSCSVPEHDSSVSTHTSWRLTCRLTHQ